MVFCFLLLLLKAARISQQAPIFWKCPFSVAQSRGLVTFQPALSTVVSGVSPPLIRTSFFHLLAVIILERISLCSSGWPGAHYVILTDLQLRILLPPPCQHWGYRCETPQLASYLGPGCPTSGPWVCKASAELAELCPQTTCLAARYLTTLPRLGRQVAPACLSLTILPSAGQN